MITGKTIGELTQLNTMISDTLIPVELSGSTYYVNHSSLTSSGSLSSRITNLVTDSASFSSRIGSLVTTSGSFSTRSTDLETASGSFSSRVSGLETSSASNSGTLLNNRSSGFVNAGVDVTLGNLKVRMSTSGYRSLQVSTVSGTYSVYGSGVYSYNGIAGSTIDAASPRAISTTPAYIAPGYTFTTAGATDTWMLMDTSNAIAWRITLIVGGGYLNNMISIERLV